MFLAICASYYARAARMDKHMYIPIIVISAILISILSTFYCYFGFGLLLPVYSFSFPFFYLGWAEWYFFFFHIPLFSTAPVDGVLRVFASFLLVNLSGVVVGHSLHKRLDEAQREIFDLFSRNFVLSLFFFFILALLSLLAGGVFLFVYWWSPFIFSFLWIFGAIAALIEIRRTK